MIWAKVYQAGVVIVVEKVAKKDTFNAKSDNTQ